MESFIYLILYGYVFVFGICISSFLCAYAYRYEHDLSVVKGRSFCPNCNERLKAADLVPLISYVFLKGRCRYCKAKISKIYPLTELFGGILCLICFFELGFTLKAVIFSLFALILMTISIVDFKTMDIPDTCSLAIFILAICNLLFCGMSIKTALVGMLLVSLPMLMINVFVKDAFGGGDIKMMAGVGLLIGIKGVLPAFFIAILLAGGYGSYLLITKKAGKGSHIAFGPYLAFGSFVASLWKDDIIYIYLKIFGLA